MTDYVDLDAVPDTRVPADNPLPIPQILRGLAFHEAAHAVEGMTAGMSLDRLRLIGLSPSQWTGSTTWAPNRVSEFGFAVECAVGEVAHLRQLREDGLLTDVTGACAASPHDRDLAVQVLATVGYEVVLSGPEPKRGTTWSEVIEAATESVQDLWAEITAVAEALLTAPGHVLTAAEVTALTGIPNPAPLPKD